MGKVLWSSLGLGGPDVICVYFFWSVISHEQKVGREGKCSPEETSGGLVLLRAEDVEKAGGHGCGDWQVTAEIHIISYL